MKKEIISYRIGVGPGETVELSERLKARGSVTQVNVRFYPGVELALRVNPYILHKGDLPENVINYVQGTDKYISGDDDYFKFPVNVDIENDEFMIVWAENISPDYSYDLVVDVEIIYRDQGRGVKNA